MALLPTAFTPSEADSDPFAPIDAGWVAASITKSELKATNDKAGKYISLQFKIDDDERDPGRLLYTNLNIVNKSEVAVKIARSDLKKICEAVGFDGDLEDTQDLHNVSMAIKVSVKPETSQWPAKNEIKDFRPIDELDALQNPE
jgi:hypothetical protein